MQLNWRNKKLQTWNLLNLSLRVWNKNVHVDVGISPMFISGGFAVLFKQINLIRNQRCFVQDWYGVAFQSSNWAQMFSWMWSIFAYSKLLLDLVFLSTHSTVTEMNPVNCVLLTVFYQSCQCNFYRPTETDSENFFSFHSFKNSWIN